MNQRLGLISSFCILLLTGTSLGTEKFVGSATGNMNGIEIQAGGGFVSNDYAKVYPYIQVRDDATGKVMRHLWEEAVMFSAYSLGELGLYLFGGIKQGGEANLDVYRISAPSLNQIEVEVVYTLREPLIGSSAHFHRGHIYLSGGIRSQKQVLFNYKLFRFKETQQTPLNGEVWGNLGYPGRIMPLMTSQSTNLYVAGGWSAFKSLDRGEVFIPLASMWRSSTENPNQAAFVMEFDQTIGGGTLDYSQNQLELGVCDHPKETFKWLEVLKSRDCTPSQKRPIDLGPISP